MTVSDEELLAVYDVAVHEEYVRREGVRFAVVPRIHGLRAVADVVCRAERAAVLARSKAAVLNMEPRRDGTVSLAEVLHALEALAP